MSGSNVDSTMKHRDSQLLTINWTHRLTSASYNWHGMLMSWWCSGSA